MVVPDLMRATYRTHDCFVVEGKTQVHQEISCQEHECLRPTGGRLSRSMSKFLLSPILTLEIQQRFVLSERLFSNIFLFTIDRLR